MLYSYFKSTICLVMIFILGTNETTLHFDKKWVTRPPNQIDYPHMILIQMSLAEDKECSGSILSNKWVLTAARCMFLNGKVVETDTSLKLFAGVADHNDLSSPTIENRTSRKVRLKINPEDFPENLYYGLALVEVDVAFQLGKTPTIKSIKVSDQGQDDLDDIFCRSWSYGFTDWHGTVDSPPFKGVEVQAKTCECAKSMEEAFPGIMPDHWFCGENDFQVNLCRGDFGAGIVCDHTLQGVLINLVGYEGNGSCTIKEKHSTACGHDTTGAIFVDVCFYLHWIQSFVPDVELNLDPCVSLPDFSKSIHNTCFLNKLVIMVISFVIQFVLF